MINPSLLDQAGDQRLDGVLITKHLHYLLILEGMVGGQEAQELFSFTVVYPDFATCSILTIEKNVENTAFGLYFFNFML